MNKSAVWFARGGLMLLLLASGFNVAAQDLQPKPDAPFFQKFEPLRAPVYHDLLLKPGDRLAIIGDSITEQKQYSRIIETYLTVCAPELKISTRQFGWSGETAEGFLRRMTNDCLRFHPTVATLCYGMNDHGYGPYKEDVAQWYRRNYSAVAQSLKDSGARVVLGSPGCVGRVPPWGGTQGVPVEELNLNLCRLRNIDIGIAAEENIRFADVFWPMLTAGYDAREKFGQDFAVSGKDGVHPNWAGHVVMAYAFLKALGLDGSIGAYVVDLSENKAMATTGHTVDSFTNNILTITSTRYPFCAAGAPDRDDSIRAGMGLVPFNAQLNRLMLVVRGGTAANYKITWGKESHTYSAAQLAGGVNLADDFQVNPFSDAFTRVSEAVFAKQNYETLQIKSLFYTPAAKADPDRIATISDEVREPLVDAIAKAFVPVTHIIRIEPQ
jgi:lysophospholipase L1-like esterase